MTLSAVSSARGEVVARILEVRGKVEVANEGKVRSAEVYGGLSVGERLTVPKQGVIVIGWLSDKRLERVRGPAVATAQEGRLDGAKPDAIKLKQTETANSSFRSLPNITTLAVTVARGVDDEKPIPPQITPINRSTLREPPCFSWPAKDGAQTYKLTVRKINEEIWPFETAKNSAIYAGAPLDLNVDYSWTVEVAEGGKLSEHVGGTFKLASDASKAEHEELAQMAMSEEVAVLALAAMRYERSLLYAEAIAVYEKLAATAGNTAAFHAALAELYYKAGRIDDSKRAHDKAEKLGFTFTKK
jgi:tetratricopeptide (TPR) repeat protein